MLRNIYLISASLALTVSLSTPSFSSDSYSDDEVSVANLMTSLCDFEETVEVMPQFQVDQPAYESILDELRTLEIYRILFQDAHTTNLELLQMYNKYLRESAADKGKKSVLGKRERPQDEEQDTKYIGGNLEEVYKVDPLDEVFDFNMGDEELSDWCQDLDMQPTKEWSLLVENDTENGTKKHKADEEVCPGLSPNINWFGGYEWDGSFDPQSFSDQTEYDLLDGSGCDEFILTPMDLVINDD